MRKKGLCGYCQKKDNTSSWLENGLKKYTNFFLYFVVREMSHPDSKDGTVVRVPKMN